MIQSLEQADGKQFFGFEDIEDGVTYKANCQSDSWKRRGEVDDQILEMEASNYLLELYRDTNCHLHPNLKLFRREGGNVLREYDFFLHGDLVEPTFGILLEAKTVPHPKDVDNLVKRSLELEGYFKNRDNYFATAGTLLKKQNTVDFKHFYNVKKVYPVLAGKLFHEINIDQFIKSVVMPMYPSGSRYIIKGLETFLKLT